VLETGKNSMFITNINIAFTELYFTTSNKFESVTLIVEKKTYLEEAYEFPKDLIYQYTNVEKLGIKNSDISNTIIKFRVEKSWISNNNINESSISLLRYSNEWKIQKTEPEFEDDTYYYYKSETNGFSYFVILGEKKQFVPVVEEKIEEVAPVIIEDIDEQPEQRKNISKILLIVFLSIITVGGILFINLRNKISFSIKNLGELRNYMLLAKAQGEQYGKIRTDLINEGWDEKDVDKALFETKLPDYLKAKMVDYVKASLNKGKTRQEIVNEFIGVGWQNEIIDGVFSSLS